MWIIKAIYNICCDFNFHKLKNSNTSWVSQTLGFTDILAHYSWGITWNRYQRDVKANCHRFNFIQIYVNIDGRSCGYVEEAHTIVLSLLCWLGSSKGHLSLKPLKFTEIDEWQIDVGVSEGAHSSMFVSCVGGAYTV